MARIGSAAYFAAFTGLPTIITEPGKYLTRGGEIVTVTVAGTSYNFSCHGSYPRGTKEIWHKSGRLYATFESLNDIVERCT